jgi:hypothetical protein
VPADQARKASASLFVDHHRQQSPKAWFARAGPFVDQRSEVGFILHRPAEADSQRRQLRKAITQMRADPTRQLHALIRSQSQAALKQAFAQRAAGGKALGGDATKAIDGDSRRRSSSHVICSKQIFFEKSSLP